MNVTVPIYVEEHRPAGAPAPLFRVRPLFFDNPVRESEHLGRAISKLAQQLRRDLDALARAAVQRELADWTFSPLLHEQHLGLTLTLRRATLRAKYLVVSFE